MEQDKELSDVLHSMIQVIMLIICWNILNHVHASYSCIEDALFLSKSVLYRVHGMFMEQDKVNFLYLTTKARFTKVADLWNMRDFLTLLQFFH